MKKINIIISLLFYGFTIAIFCMKGLPELPDLPEQTKGLSKEERQQQYKDEASRLLETQKTLNEAHNKLQALEEEQSEKDVKTIKGRAARLEEKTAKMQQEGYKKELEDKQKQVNKRLEELRKNDETKKIVEEAEKKQRETATALNEGYEPSKTEALERETKELLKTAQQLSPANKIRNDIQNTITERLFQLNKQPSTIDFNNQNAAGYKSAWEEAYKNKLEADHLLQYIDDLQKHKNSAGVEGLEELKTGAESASKKWGEQLGDLDRARQERSARFYDTEKKSLRIQREVLQDLSPLAENIQKLDVKLTAGYEPLTSFDNAMFYLTDVGRTFARKAKVLFKKAKIKLGNKSLEIREELAELYGLLGDEIGQIKNARLAAEMQEDAAMKLSQHVKSLQGLDLQKDTDKGKFNQELQDTALAIIKAHYDEWGPESANRASLSQLRNELKLLKFKPPKDYTDVDDFVDRVPIT